MPKNQKASPLNSEKSSSSKSEIEVKHSNSFFKRHKSENKGQHCVQNVNVEVNIDQKDDCMVGCFKAIASCFKKGP